MAKAHIETPDGVVVKLEGTPEEISAVLRDAKVKAASGGGRENPRKSKGKAKGGKATLPDLLEDLRGEGFCNTAISCIAPIKSSD